MYRILSRGYKLWQLIFLSEDELSSSTITILSDSFSTIGESEEASVHVQIQDPLHLHLHTVIPRCAFCEIMPTKWR